MKIVLQRVTHASVSVAGRVTASIGAGYVLLVGVGSEDTEQTVVAMANDVVHLRVMADEDEKMNMSILDTNGEILVVSQFTLYADTSHGRRPYFGTAAEPEKAGQLLDRFVLALSDFGVPVKEGEFGAYMQVALVNDGPVTIVLEKKP